MLDGLVIEGPIMQSNFKAWDCMASRQDLLQRITDCFAVRPFRYLSIVAPIQAGKSTIIQQIRAGLEARNVPTTVVEIDFLHLRAGISCEEIVEKLVTILREAVASIVELPPVLGTDLTSTEDLQITEIITSVMAHLPKNAQFVLVLENVDCLIEEAGWELLTSMRQLHDDRLGTDLERFSVVATSRSSLTIQHGEISSPFNCATEFVIPDLSEKEVHAFVRNVAKLNNIKFEESALNAILDNVGGVASLLQELLSRLSRSSPVTQGAVADAIGTILETSSRFSRFALTKVKLSKDGMSALQAILRKTPLLAFEGDVGYRELRQRGLVEPNRTHWAVFRCRLIELMSAVSYVPSVIAPGFSIEESLIATLPHVKLLLSNQPFLSKIVDAAASHLNRIENDKARKSQFPQLIERALTEMDLPIDLGLSYLLLRRYWDVAQLGQAPNADRYCELLYSVISKSIIQP